MTDQTAGETLAHTEDTTVVISRSVSSDVKDVWRALATREGGVALLGEGGVIGGKGESWHAADGTYGVTRSYHPFEQIRFSWHETEDAPKTLVDLHLLPSDDGTTIEISHEHVPATTDTAMLQARWEAALDRVAALL